MVGSRYFELTNKIGWHGLTAKRPGPDPGSLGRADNESQIGWGTPALKAVLTEAHAGLHKTQPGMRYTLSPGGNAY